MECNRDEAIRAKEIAERKFTGKDIAGAKKFALKAQALYPGLEGIQQMLATLDVYSSAENKLFGESDWYGILGVNPSADEEAVRRHYRKLALMLHPDKNKSVGAEGAFKLISEAWSLLSNKAKRFAYDQKRNAKVPKQKVPKQTGGPPAAPPGANNGFNNFTKPTSSHKKAQKNSTTKASASSVPASNHKQKPATFWTVCHRCKMQYEYLRVYLNHNLLCPNCHQPFFAIETAPPPSNGGAKASDQPNNSQQHRNSNHQGVNKNIPNAGNKSTTPNAGSGKFSGPDSSNHSSFQWGPFSKRGGTSSAAHAATVVQQTYEKVKREREEAQAAVKREEALRRKTDSSKRMGGVSSSGKSGTAKRRKVMEDVGASTNGRNGTNQMGAGTRIFGMTNLSGPKQVKSGNSGVVGTNKRSITRDISHFESQNMLMEKARKEIRKRLKEWSSASVSESAVSRESNLSEKTKEKPKPNDTAMGNAEQNDQHKSGEPVNNKNVVHVDESKRALSSESRGKDYLEPMTISVPDSEFHDFDKDRAERSFGENQVWAAYDDDDGMPRYYALIHDVISLNPFKMRISWLNSKTNSELGPLNWVGSGFSKTCGEFRIGKHEINNSLNSFSHKVKWRKGTRGAIQIFPRKGDVWALYRNWSPEWNELTTDEIIHKYDMVEVLEDFDEELGVTVTPLVKVAGFKAVFHRHLDPKQIRRIPREEMFRFSHHVPSYLLTGQEARNAPKGCHELDPAATPVELLQVIIDVIEEELVENEQTIKEDETSNIVGKANNEDREENFGKDREEISGHTRETKETEPLKASKEIKERGKVEPASEKIIS